MIRMNLEKVKVVEIFFEEDPQDPKYLQPFPCFLLENGQLKRPRVGKGAMVMWATDEEMQKVIMNPIIKPSTSNININLK